MIAYGSLLAVGQSTGWVGLGGCFGNCCGLRGVVFDGSVVRRVQRPRLKPSRQTHHIHKVWDGPVAANQHNPILRRAPSDVDKARLLAAASPHSGDWLHAPPITAAGLRLSDDAIRAAVARVKGNTLIYVKFGVEKSTSFSQLLHARFHARSCSVMLDLPAINLNIASLTDRNTAGGNS